MDDDVKRVHDDLKKLAASLEARGVGGAVLCIVAAAKLHRMSDSLKYKDDQISALKEEVDGLRAYS